MYKKQINDIREAELTSWIKSVRDGLVNASISESIVGESQSYHVMNAKGQEILVATKDTGGKGKYYWGRLGKIAESYEVVYKGSKSVMRRRDLRYVYNMVQAVKAKQVESR